MQHKENVPHSPSAVTLLLLELNPIIVLQNFVCTFSIYLQYSYPHTSAPYTMIL